MLIGFLGYNVSKEGYHPDPEKVNVMLEWKPPKTLKVFRGFLELTSSYGRFIKGYVHIATSMTNFLIKDNFEWNDEANLVL